MGYSKPDISLLVNTKIQFTQIPGCPSKWPKKIFEKKSGSQKNGYFWREKLNILKSAEFQKKLLSHFDRA